jgi:uncharacterized protein (DUF736 family)
MAYDRPSSVLFKNNNKKSENHPDMTGKIELSDEEIESIIDQQRSGVRFPTLDVSAWTKTSSKGNRFISMAVKKPWKKEESRQTPAANNHYDNKMDDEIPF